ncbi:DUF6297 family protein, partial [Luedemannella flava]|uniref:DUF6297 family protein n=1 Tax=Luedemannella flava TaxID=349316 RepID=UPI0031DF8B36
GIGLAAGGGAVAVATVVAHFAGAGLVRPTGSLTIALALVGPPLALVGCVVAVRALGRVDRASLSGGAQLTSAAVAAAALLDPTMLTGLVESRRWRRVGRVRSRRFLRGGRAWALLQAEVRRLYRNPVAPLTWAGLILLEYAVAVAVPSIAAPARVIGAYLAVSRLTGGLRTLTRSPGLRRSLGGSDAAVRAVHLVVPAIGAALWWLATAPVGRDLPGWMTYVMIAGVVVAAHRTATRPPLDYGGAFAETPFGIIPVDLLRRIFRGPDLVAVLVVAQLLVP